MSPWECQCNEVDTLEPLKCWPCKKCEKRAIDMKSSLLLSSSEKRKEANCQTMEEGEYQTECQAGNMYYRVRGPEVITDRVMSHGVNLVLRLVSCWF